MAGLATDRGGDRLATTLGEARAVQSDTPAAVRAVGLTKAFGRSMALRGVDLEVREGETLVLFGPNGAGKTTLLRILATLSRPTGGQVSLAGLDLRREANAIRRRLGVVLHQTFLYDDLTVDENLTFYGRMYDVENLEARIKTVLRQVGLEHRRHSTVRTLSRGMQQRATIARAILHEPSIVLLDEPDTGLDQEGFEMLIGTLRDWGTLRDRRISRDQGASREVGVPPDSPERPRTVLMTTHNLERGLAVSDRVAIISGGKITFQGASNEFKPEEFPELYSRYTRVLK